MKSDEILAPIRRTLVIGGLGEVGNLLARSMTESGVRVTIADSRHCDHDSMVREQACNYMHADAASPSRELMFEIQSSDCVCLCLPERVTVDAIASVLPLMPKGSLWVDTLSVKTELARVLEQYVGQYELLSLNPMFAPRLGWAQNRVAAVEISTGPKTRALCQLISSWGAHVVPIEAVAHDELTAAIQVATHAAVLAFGHCLVQLNLDITKAVQLATPPHRLLLSLLHRITHQNPEVYWDIQTWHPRAPFVRDKLAEGVARLQQTSRADGQTHFEEMFEEIKRMLDADPEIVKQWSRQFFAN